MKFHNDVSRCGLPCPFPLLCWLLSEIFKSEEQLPSELEKHLIFLLENHLLFILSFFGTPVSWRSYQNSWIDSVFLFLSCLHLSVLSLYFLRDCLIFLFQAEWNSNMSVIIFLISENVSHLLMVAFHSFMDDGSFLSVYFCHSSLFSRLSSNVWGSSVVISCLRKR